MSKTFWIAFVIATAICVGLVANSAANLAQMMQSRNDAVAEVMADM